MMSPHLCYQRAELCEANAAESTDPEMRAAWLETARSWRGLGDDRDGGGTLARLMQGRE